MILDDLEEDIEEIRDIQAIVKCDHSSMLAEFPDVSLPEKVHRQLDELGNEANPHSTKSLHATKWIENFEDFLRKEKFGCGFRYHYSELRHQQKNFTEVVSLTPKLDPLQSATPMISSAQTTY